jgi:hypothetical protein
MFSRLLYPAWQSRRPKLYLSEEYLELKTVHKVVTTHSPLAATWIQTISAVRSTQQRTEMMYWNICGWKWCSEGRNRGLACHPSEFVPTLGLPFVPSFRFIRRTQIPQLITVCISGDRKIKIPVMDPLFIPQFRLISHGLDVSVQNSTALGMKDVILKKVG